MTDRIVSKFGAFTSASEVAAGHDLTGVTAIVTGGASGIGFETAKALSAQGCQVVLAVRRPDQGLTAADEIAKSSRGPKPRICPPSRIMTRLHSARADGRCDMTSTIWPSARAVAMAWFRACTPGSSRL